MSRLAASDAIQRAVIILGPYRSGTSLTSLICSKLGVCFGPRMYMLSGSPRNPGGYFERADINRSNDRFIESAGRNLAEPGEPPELVERGDASILHQVDLRWSAGHIRWGIKDPRHCATLLASIEAGVFDRNKVLIVHVCRSLDTATASGVRDKCIPSFCDGTAAGIRAMLSRYAELAQWHVDHLALPSIRIDYEQLVAHPEQTVARLGAFLGIGHPRRLRRAAKVVGAKNSLLVKSQLYRYFLRAPQRLFYTCAGRGWPPKPVP